MTSNSFCRHLSNGFRIFIKDGRVSWMPCCYWQGDEFDFDQHEQIRQQINISTPWRHRECNRCRDEEAYKDLGYRLAGNRVIPVMSSNKAGWIDIQADLTCNGGCLICGPWSSSYWQTELAKHGEWRLERNTKNLEQLVESIFTKLDVSELRMLQFLGGEPFLSNVDSWAIRHVPNPELCTLKYTTNGSVYPSADRMASWHRFQEVVINFSIDGIGSRFEYLRYPLQWSKVEANIGRLVNETGLNLKFHINHTVTPLNIWYYDEFVEWTKRTFPSHRLSGIHTHTAYGVMNVAATTLKVRKMIQHKYGSNHVLYKMLQSNPESTNNFWQWIDLWDQRRNTDWQQVFPDIV